MNERQRFLDACLLQAAGRLPLDEAQWLTQTLKKHPDWQSDLDSAQAMVRFSREAIAHREVSRPPVMSFDEVRARLPEAAPLQRRHPAWLAAVLNWWQRPSSMGLVLATVSAMAIGLGVQTYRIDGMSQTASGVVDDGAGYRSADAAKQASLSLRVTPDATIGQVSTLLKGRQLRVIDGPDDDQTYLVSGPEDMLPGLLEALRQESIVLSANRVVNKP